MFLRASLTSKSLARRAVLMQARSRASAEAVTSSNEASGEPPKFRSLSRATPKQGKKRASSTSASRSESKDNVSEAKLSETKDLAMKKRAAINKAVELINKTHGAGTIQTSKDLYDDMDRISTGSLTLDAALGGGIGRGCVVEIYGPESCAKTSLAICIMAEAQRKYPNDYMLFIDLEHSFDSRFAEGLGLSGIGNQVYVSRPEHGEAGLQAAETIIRSGAASVVVVDSVAACISEADLARDVGEFQIGSQARLMSTALRILNQVAKQYNTTLILINQIRYKINTGGYGNPETTSGGLALKYYANQRIEVRRKEVYAGANYGDPAVGVKVAAKITKNKTAAPMGHTTFDFYFDRGIDKTGSTLDGAVKAGIITMRGSYYYYKNDEGEEVSMGHGRGKAIEFMQMPENEGLVELMKQEALLRLVPGLRRDAAKTGDGSREHGQELGFGMDDM